MITRLGGIAVSKVCRLEFMGSWFWLIVLTILFFPVAIVYAGYTTISVEEQVDADKFLEWYRTRRLRRPAA